MAVRHDDVALVAGLSAMLLGPSRDWSGLPEASQGHLVVAAVGMAEALLSEVRDRVGEAPAVAAEAPKAPDKPVHHESPAAKPEADHHRKRG